MCSYTRTPPPMSPSRSSSAGTAGSSSGSPPPRDRRLASRNSIFIGPTIAQTILLRCSSSDEEAEDDGRIELGAAAEEEEGDQSRTDASEDSVEVRVLPIAPNPQSSLLQKSKRKLSDPRKFSGPRKMIPRESHGIACHSPLRERHYSRLPRPFEEPPSSIKNHFPLSHIYHPRDAQIPQTTTFPFRPWSSEYLPERRTATPTAYTPPSSTDSSSQAEPPVGGLELRGDPPARSDQPSLPLYLNANGSSGVRGQDKDIPEDKEVQEARWEGQLSRELGKLPSRSDSPAGICVSNAGFLEPRGRHEAGEVEHQLEEEEEEDECDGDVPMALEAASTSSAMNAAGDSPTSPRQSGSVNVTPDVKDLSEQKNHLRNYKNMTRERRMEANARERTRVHTISAAFDTLRRAVPAYAHNQRLSKLSVLRIACAYIVTLSRVAGKDYSAGNDAPSLAECVDSVTRTIQTEGKVRRRRDE
ncbi:uncharacterized protein net [Hetaerina americana]|uniref:uncharacterized protein net n=1 Tax=Hetaerina americana TaxID=62018 RepID=UPI003A7F5F27